MTLAGDFCEARVMDANSTFTPADALDHISVAVVGGRIFSAANVRTRTAARRREKRQKQGTASPRPGRPSNTVHCDRSTCALLGGMMIEPCGTAAA